MGARHLLSCGKYCTPTTLTSKLTVPARGRPRGRAGGHRRDPHHQPGSAGAALRLPGLAARGARTRRLRGRLPGAAAERRPAGRPAGADPRGRGGVRADGHRRPHAPRAPRRPPGRAAPALEHPALRLSGRPRGRSGPGATYRRRRAGGGGAADLRLVRGGGPDPARDCPPAERHRHPDGERAGALGSLHRPGDPAQHQLSRRRLWQPGAACAGPAALPAQRASRGGPAG